MIDAAAFCTGLSLIGIQLNQPVAKDVQRAFHLAMEDETTAEEWQAFIRVAVKRFAWTFLPPVPALLDALREFRGAPKLDAEAVAAYERVIRASDYNPHAGTYYELRSIVGRCGKAAGEAFMAAGGPRAFESDYREDDRRRKFVVAYVAAARAEPAGRLLPAAPPQRFLPAGQVSPERGFEQIGRGEAAELLAKIAGLNASEGP